MSFAVFFKSNRHGYDLKRFFLYQFAISQQTDKFFHEIFLCIANSFIFNNSFRRY